MFYIYSFKDTRTHPHGGQNQQQVCTSEQMQKHFKIDSLENFGKHYLFIALLTSIYGTLAMFVIIHLL